MNIVVCVKRVPDLAEAEIVIDKTQKGIVKDDLVFDINEWDNYAVEEAVLIKERLGGIVTAVTLGDEDSEEVLRRALAVGADNAARIWGDEFENGDAYATARALAAAIRKMSYDVIFTGAQASDDGFAQVGPTIAEILGIPHATIVTKVDLEGKVARVHRELEAGIEEVVEVQLPAVLTIQTGINEPRYVSIAGIRRVAKREIEELGIKDLALAPSDVGASGSKVLLEKLFVPPAMQKGERLEGAADAVAEKLVSIFASKGWLA